MTTKKKRLGRGLEALLGAAPSTATNPIPTPPASEPASTPEVVNAKVPPVDTAPATVPFPNQKPTIPPAANPSSMNTRQTPTGSVPSPPRTPSKIPSPVATKTPNTTVTKSPVSGTEWPADAPVSDMVRLNVFDVEDNPFQPRREFGQPEIASLAESLKEHDMLQPILVRKIGKKFQLISGERRLRAAIQAGWKTIPARIREADDRLVAELAIVENLQRKDLNPLEKALSFKRYLKEHNARQEDLSARLKIDRSTVANLMRLLELPEAVQNQLRKTVITAGHARALLPLGEENEQIDFCNKVIKEGWSVRETERRVSDHLADGDPAKAASKKKKANPQIESLEKQARMSLGTKVEIKATAKGSGKMVVHFKNQKEFQRIFEQVCREYGALSKAA